MLPGGAEYSSVFLRVRVYMVSGLKISTSCPRPSLRALLTVVYWNLPHQDVRVAAWTPLSLTMPWGFRPVLTYQACFLCILLFLMKIEVRYHPKPRVEDETPRA